MKALCRELNVHGRLLYKSFIERVGRNVYPVIIASDHEPEFSGVGTTFTLFLQDGKYCQGRGEGSGSFKA